MLGPCQLTRATALASRVTTLASRVAVVLWCGWTARAGTGALTLPGTQQSHGCTEEQEAENHCLPRGLLSLPFRGSGRPPPVPPPWPPRASKTPEIPPRHQWEAVSFISKISADLKKMLGYNVLMGDYDLYK